MSLRLSEFEVGFKVFLYSLGLSVSKALDCLRLRYDKLALDLRMLRLLYSLVEKLILLRFLIDFCSLWLAIFLVLSYSVI